MQTSYHITASGIKYVVASNAQETDRSLLLYILKKNNTPVSFNEIVIFFKDDKKSAFTEICKLIKLEFIDIIESNSLLKNINQTNTDISTTDKTINHQYTKKDFVLSDLNGFPVTYSGFNHQQSLTISAVAYDFIQASSRARHNHEKQFKPLSIKTFWQDMDITIFLLFFGNFSCILTTKDSGLLDEIGFTYLASFLCNRYNYE